jgi:hypothetical protein
MDTALILTKQASRYHGCSGSICRVQVLVVHCSVYISCVFKQVLHHPLRPSVRPSVRRSSYLLQLFAAACHSVTPLVLQLALCTLILALALVLPSYLDRSRGALEGFDPGTLNAGWSEDGHLLPAGGIFITVVPGCTNGKSLHKVS